MESMTTVDPTMATLVLLVAATAIALAFEAVNGFHDAANAVATVIYTNSLKPRTAVVLSGIFNFLGVYIGGIAVAFAIVHLLPVDLLVNIGSHAGMAMVFALLISAITWNLGTWYKGIPASSSHTLIGAIIGVGIANALVEGEATLSGVSVRNLQEVSLSLLISPLLGFGLAAVLFLMVQRRWNDPCLYDCPADRKPPFWVRAALVMTAGGVSLAHGSNDGQKGIGLIMLILIGTLPAHFALNTEYRPKDNGQAVQSLAYLEFIIQRKKAGLEAKSHASDTQAKDHMMSFSSRILDPMLQEIQEITAFLNQHEQIGTVLPQERWRIRTYILMMEDHLKAIENTDYLHFNRRQRAAIDQVRSELRRMTDYAPPWVMLMVAAAIGLGTMVGWKRVVVTVGEKLGQEPLNYAQGASAQTVAAVTIGLADVLGLPVSTTHVLSSGVTGTMVANQVGLKYATLRDIALAWILTLPVSMLLAGMLFILFRMFVP